MNDAGHTDQDRLGVSRRTAPMLASDRFYRALSSTTRRRLLHALLDGERRSIEDVVTVLSGFKTIDTGTMGSSNDRRRMTIELVHNHLPLLAEADLVDYDHQKGSVRIERLDPAVKDLIVRSIESEPSKGS